MSSASGPEHYVSILSFVDKTQLEPGCTVLLHNKVMSVVGILSDEADPMVSVMKVRREETHLPFHTHARILSDEAESMVSVMKVRREETHLPFHTHARILSDEAESMVSVMKMGVEACACACISDLVK